VQAFGTRVLARMASRSADLAFVSTPAWTPLIAAAAPQLPVRWQPIPSNIATTANAVRAAALAERYRSARGGALLGHFGTYRMRDARHFLERLLPVFCLRADDRSVVLLGRGSDAFAASLIAAHPLLAGRIHGVGDLAADDLADHLCACDVLVQPYSDGATTRRGSLFAALALGVPTVTTAGRLTEDLWHESGAAYFAPPDDIDATLALIEEALAQTDARRAIGERARALYMSRFDVAHTVEMLRSS
jgi:glycosyltransferase involved in cell wall biosynthesis